MTAGFERLRPPSRAGLALLPSMVLVAALATPVPDAAWGAELVVYSGRKESAFKPVVERFEREAGVRVSLKIGKTSGLANEILQERRRPRADVFVATEAGIGEILGRAGLLEPYQAPRARLIPSEYRSSQGLWTGISGRARIILYNTRLVGPDDLPTSVLELTHARWRGKIAIAGTLERTTLAWLAALIHVLGEARARAYIDGLLENGLKILPDNTDVWRAVGNGEVAVGLTNSPNYHLALEAGLPVGAIYPDQGPSGMGVLVNPNVVAIVKGASNLQDARRFVDFLLTPSAQEILVHRAFEIPLVPGANPGKARPLTDFKALKVGQERLADLQARALELFPGF